MVECQIVALKVMGSSPIIRPKYFCSLGGIGRRDRLKICSLSGCWFKSNSEYSYLGLNLLKYHLYLQNFKV
jgi:hypothetical protein